jgi:hypothetical protein
MNYTLEKPNISKSILHYSSRINFDPFKSGTKHTQLFSTYFHRLFSAYFHKLFQIAYMKITYLYFTFCNRNSLYNKMQIKPFIQTEP